MLAPVLQELQEACPLCGAELDAGRERCHCPKSAACAVVCCPRCFYTFPSERIGLAGILRRFFRRRRDR